MNEKIMVVLEDDTCGFIDSDSVDYDCYESMVGDKLNIHLSDENGNPIEKIGVIKEILGRE